MTPEAPAVPLLTTLADGLPDVVMDPTALAAAVAVLKTGTGPVAVDAERAHGFRYSTRAYLIQLRRAGAGTHLIDPIALQPDGFDARGADSPCADLSTVREAIVDAEWIIHAATQDLPCLTQLGLSPTTLFDTELAGRLLNYPRVALSTMVEEVLGVRLLKEHSASDWSTRPLPAEWLVYAALDVEVLIELRAAMGRQLVEAGKDEWARQEFAALVAGAGAPAEPREDPWRRTSGVHKVKSPAGLALVRELWQVRDAMAREEDRAPGRILQDAAISQLAEQVDRDGASWPDRRAMMQIDGFKRRVARSRERDWLVALTAAQRMTRTQWPPLHLHTDGPPAPRSWPTRYPEAAGRLTRVREAARKAAEEHRLPVENLIQPETLRRLAWKPPRSIDDRSVDRFLADLGVRPWQRGLCVPALVAALTADP